MPDVKGRWGDTLTDDLWYPTYIVSRDDLPGYLQAATTIAGAMILEDYPDDVPAYFRIVVRHAGTGPACWA